MRSGVKARPFVLIQETTSQRDASCDLMTPPTGGSGVVATGLTKSDQALLLTSASGSFLLFLLKVGGTGLAKR